VPPAGEPGIPFESLRGAAGARALEADVVAATLRAAPRVLELPAAALAPGAAPGAVVRVLACETRAAPPPYVPPPSAAPPPPAVKAEAGAAAPSAPAALPVAVKQE
jgi:hypothetical protein